MENTKTAEETVELGKKMSLAFDKWKSENEDCFVGPVSDKYLFNRLWLAFMRGGDATESHLKKRIEELEAELNNVRIILKADGYLYTLEAINKLLNPSTNGKQD